MKLDSTSAHVSAMGLLGTLAEQGPRVEKASLVLSSSPDELAPTAGDGGLLTRVKGFAQRSGQVARSRVGRLVRIARGRPQALPARSAPELTLPWLASDHPKDSESYQVLVAEQEALKMQCKALMLIQQGARESYGRSATALLEHRIEGITARGWIQGGEEEAVARLFSESGDDMRMGVSETLDIWAQEAHGLIRDTYAQVPLALPSQAEETWLGADNSPERLCNLHTALAAIRDSDLPWTTTLTAAKLLNELVHGISLEHWSEQDRAAVYWLGRADPAQKQAAADELGRWADEAFRFLDRTVAKHGLGFI